MLRERQFNRLCADLSDEVYRYALGILGNAADAEDVTQEALLKLWQQLPMVLIRNPKAWLLRTTRNCCLDLFRRRMRREGNRDLSEDYLLDQVDPAAPDPGKELDAQLMGERLRGALGQLTEVHRSIFMLLEVNQLKLKEVAEVLNLPLGTVKVYRQRAREHLQKILKEDARWIRN